MPSLKNLRADISLCEEEIWVITFTLMDKMLSSAKRHWFKHYAENETSFAEYVCKQESERHKLFVFLNGLLGRQDVTESLKHELNSIYKTLKKEENK